MRVISISALLLIGGGSVIYSIAGPDLEAGEHHAEAIDDAPLVDAPLEPYRRRLLDIAFESASAVPLMPHVKTRSQVQEVVADALLELDQPHRAQSAIEKIENWRRGIGYADLALYAAQRSNECEARRHLAPAIQMTDTMATEAYVHAADDGIEGAQSWRRDRIRAKIACAQLLLGETEEAAATAADLEASEIGPVEVMKAKLAGASAFEKQIRSLQDAAQAGGLDGIRSALARGIEVYKAVYSEPEKRLQLEQELEACIHRAPAMVRVDLYARLADCALVFEDAEKALELVSDARFASGVVDWLPKEGIPIDVRLAELRYRAGEREKARAELDAALAVFDANIAEIADLDRAETLCPIAGAYQKMGDPAAALAVYRRAVEEGARNPNAVPRAEDLAATLTSMALHAIEPDEALWNLIEEIRSGLGDPW